MCPALTIHQQRLSARALAAPQRCPLTGPGTPFFTHRALVMLIYARPVPLRCPPAAASRLPFAAPSYALNFDQDVTRLHISPSLPPPPGL